MNLSELVSGSIGTQAVEGISNQLGIAPEKTKWVVSAAIPLMVSSLKYNAEKKPESTQQIQALADKHEGNIFENLGSLFGSSPSQEDSQIVNHIFGKNTNQVQQSLAEKSGLSTDKVAGILALLGPIIMGFIGKQRQGTSGGLGDLLGGLIKDENTTNAAGEGFGGIIGNILGGDKANSANTPTDGLGDLAGEFFNQGNDSKKQGSILDNLAGMFSKK